MKRKICVIIIVLLCFSLFLNNKGGSFASGSSSSKVIYVVFDNSGSMYMESNPAWSQATYAMEVFASMLDFQAGDRMKVYTMHNVSTDGVSKVSSENVIDISSKNDIKKIHNMYTEFAGGTPFTPVTQAARDLERAAGDEKWLVVLTDGAFDSNVPGDDVRSALTDIAGKSDDTFVQYLAMGPWAMSIKGGNDLGFYSDHAATSEAVIEKLADISNRIFKRNSIASYTSGEPLVFDIPVSKVIVFAQGEGVSVDGLSGAGTQIREKDSNQVSYSTTTGTGSYTCITDTSLKGVVVTYEPDEPLTEGEYTLEVGSAKQISVYYEPDVTFEVALFDKNGNRVQDGEPLELSEYIIKAGFIDGSSGEFIEGSSLIGEAHYELNVNGQIYQIRTADGSAAEQRITPETGHLEITGSVTYLTGYVDSAIISFKVSLLAATLTFAESGYQLKTLEDDSEGVLITVMRNDAPLTREEWKSLNLPEVSGKAKLGWEVKPGDEVSTFIAYPRYHKGDMYKTKTGDIPFEITISGTFDGVYGEVAVSDVIHIENDMNIADYIRRYWKQFLALLLLTVFILGYVPPFKKYLPKSVKKNPLITKKPTGLGKKSTEPGAVSKNLLSTLIPYKAQTGTARFAAMGTKPAVPKLQLKAAGRSSMYIMNYKDYAGKTYILFDGISVDADAKKPVKLFAGSDCKVKTSLFTSNCVLNQRD